MCLFHSENMSHRSPLHGTMQRFRPLLAGIPKGINIEDLQTMLERIPGVIKVHNLRVWSLSMDKPALSAHIVIGESVQSTSHGFIAARWMPCIHSVNVKRV